MKDLDEASFFIGVKFKRDRGIELGVSLVDLRKSTLRRLLKIFGMQNYDHGEVLMVKGDKFSKVSMSAE